MTAVPPLATDARHPAPAEIAAQAKLRYVNNHETGFTRKRVGRGFSYVDAKGERITDPALRARFAALVIPPAWREVWICKSPNGHIQATGRDEKGRKQYIYHPRWAAARDLVKFNRVLPFGRALAQLRQQVAADLRKRGLPHAKVTALVLRLLDETLIRIGNLEYARANGSFGLTTLQDEHVEAEGNQVSFSFIGKSGQARELTLHDRQLARLVKQCQDLPGQELFQYFDETGLQCVLCSEDVNNYLRTATGDDFTAKDFRTWGGTVAMVHALEQLGPGEDAKARQANITKAVKATAAELGNTPTICRNYYIHPAVISAYEAGRLLPLHEQIAKQMADYPALDEDEATVMVLLAEAGG